MKPLFMWQHPRRALFLALAVLFASALVPSSGPIAIAAADSGASGAAPASLDKEQGERASDPAGRADVSETEEDTKDIAKKQLQKESPSGEKNSADQKPGKEISKAAAQKEKEPGKESPKLIKPPPELWPWGEPFAVTTSDGMILRGMYRPPRDPSRAVVIFQTGGRTDLVTGFRPLVARLAAKGYGIAAYDTRGVGFSMERTDGTRFDLNAHSTDAEPYKQMIEDLKAVVKYLKQEKEVRPQRMVLCGLSIGGNVAIMAAAELPMDIRSVVAISAGTNYHGLQPLSAAQNLGGRSLLAFGAANDAFAYGLIQKLKFNVPNSTSFIVSGGEHGASLLTAENIEKIADWLDAH